MTFIIEFIVDEFKDVDKVQANSILEAKRNLIAKVGSLNIKFESVVKS